MSLLSEADRLGMLAELVGLTAMPGSERMVMLGGRLLRECVLQQSSLSTTDAYCSVEKGAGLVDAVLDVVDTCQRVVDVGVPATAVEEVDFGLLVRARDETGPHDVDGVNARRDGVLACLEGLS
jgi:V/A-type H+-transporting ATPase subunit A